jgi:hypothetical protein|tara:strand:+ start:371 stop:580 length:210 start_codon:yes stop_codon:yes gene_type:complete
MTDLRIDELVKDGWWIQVSPLANDGSGWICGIYKKGKKTGNWSTVESRKFKTPNDCYHWATLKIKYEKL